MASSSSPSPHGFTLIAHRGDSASAPENTLAAFDAALACGAAHVETDVQLSADGAVVVLHDEQLGRTNDGAGPVAAATLAELRALDAGAWFGGDQRGRFAGQRIPTLGEVLDRYRGAVHLHLELKSQQPQLPAAVAALVQQHGWALPPAPAPSPQQQQQQGTAAQAAAEAARLLAVPGITITSFHLQQLQESKKLLPAIPHGWLVQEVNQPLVDQACACRLEMLCPRANALTTDGVALMAARGLVIRAWGIKTLELLHHVVACGAHGATVNWPAQAARALQEKEQEQQQSCS